MYQDSKPCEVCGAPVELRARTEPETDDQGRVGPADGVVGGGDPTVDQRVCTDADCPTHAPDGPAA
ncbi:hypothetical protein GCM10009795_022290 [Nocardioides hankookensis]|uniref:Uncharacterized protein n=1 Tax=Nocardioides hankookensis TaxID=443157 RepID=A0ABW1LHC2_9ACTN